MKSIDCTGGVVLLIDFDFVGGNQLPVLCSQRRRFCFVGRKIYIRTRK